MQTYTFFGKARTFSFQLVSRSPRYDKNNTFSCHVNMTNDNIHKTDCQIKNLTSPKS